MEEAIPGRGCTYRRGQGCKWAPALVTWRMEPAGFVHTLGCPGGPDLLPSATRAMEPVDLQHEEDGAQWRPAGASRADEAGGHGAACSSGGSALSAISGPPDKAPVGRRHSWIDRYLVLLLGRGQQVRAPSASRSGTRSRGLRTDTFPPKSGWAGSTGATVGTQYPALCVWPPRGPQACPSGGRPLLCPHRVCRLADVDLLPGWAGSGSPLLSGVTHEHTPRARMKVQPGGDPGTAGADLTQCLTQVQHLASVFRHCS